MASAQAFRAAGMALVMAFAPMVQAGSGDVRLKVGAPSACAIDPAQAARTRSDIIDSVNLIRAAYGLEAVRASAALMAAAQAHAEDLAQAGLLSHHGSDGTTMVHRVSRAAYAGHARAENIAWGQRSGAAVMAAWHDSPGHLANMLIADADDIGVGHACLPQTGHFWTMLLGRRGPVWMLTQR